MLSKGCSVRTVCGGSTYAYAINPIYRSWVKSRETTHALLNPNIADANSALLKSCESTIRVSIYYWHEAVWSVGLLLSIHSAFVVRLV